MIEARKISYIIMIITALIFLFVMETIIYLVYSNEVANSFFNGCQDNVKFLVSELDILNINGKSSIIETGELQKNIAGILSYYKVENRLKLIVFKRKSGVVIYPIYSSRQRINDEIEKITKDKIEGKIKNKDIFGYYFYYKPADLSIIAYRYRNDLFYYRDLLLFLTAAIFLIFLAVILVMDIKRNRLNIKFLKNVTTKFKDAFELSESSFRLKEIKDEEYMGNIERELINSFNRMAGRVNMIIQRQGNKIREMSKQRSNLRKLAYYYKKFSIDVPKIEEVDEHFVEKLSNKRVPLAVLSLKLTNYFEQINEVYPEIISRELETFYRYINSIIKNRYGFINNFEGNYFNIVFGLTPDDISISDKSFDLAVMTARDIHDWILNRNKEKNVTGVPWKSAIGVTYGDGIAGVIGNSMIVVGEIVDLSKKLMQLAEDYKINCVTDSEEKLKYLQFRYRTLDRINVNSHDKEIFEIFFSDEDNIEDVIKLYHHGLEMYFEGKYEIAALEFKKVNQILNPDNPSLLFLNRINLKFSKN